jgi:outer membrane protein assembly factor BamB
MSLDRATGNVIWQQTANEQVPHEGFRQGDNSFASGSPTTDGQYLYASFGSYGIYCYDLEGRPIWQRDLGDMRTRNSFGEGASPTLHGDRLVVNWDHEGESFIVSLDAKTGDTQWKVSRDEPSSWATPLVIEHQGRTQVIVNGTNRVRSYDLANGEVIWECGGQTVNVIPTPIASDGIAVCMTGFRGSAIFAIPLDAKGDLTDSDKTTWYHDGTTPYKPGSPYTPSPLMDGGLLYFLKSNSAILSCLTFKSGEVVYDNQRLPSLRGVYASPVAAAEQIYIVGRNGTTAVLKRAPQFELVATNIIDDPIDASPAIVDNEIYLRSKQHLYCIAPE